MTTTTILATVVPLRFGEGALLEAGGHTTWFDTRAAAVAEANARGWTWCLAAPPVVEPVPMRSS